MRSIFAAFFLAITLPYLLGLFLVPFGTTWGGLLFKADDQNVHLAWAKQAQEGAFCFRDLFTSESLISGEKPLFFNALPYAMGLLSRFCGLHLVVIYHLTRAAGALWALWEFYQLARVALPSARARVLSLALVALTTGTAILLILAPTVLGGIQFIDHPNPINYAMPEAFFFTSAFAYPLNIFSYGLLALIYRQICRAEHGLTPKNAVLTCVAALLLANVHTYDAVPLIVVLLIWTALRGFAGKRQVALACGAALLGAAGPIFYQLVVFRGSAEFREKALTLTLPPPPVHLIFTLFPLLILGGWGWWQSRRDRSTALLALWAITVFLLIYAPGISFARKMLEGAQMPLCLLAGIGLASWLDLCPGARARQFVAGGIVGTLALSPLYFVGWSLDNEAQNNGAGLRYFMPPLALTEGEWGALDFVAATHDTRTSTLCLPFLGSYGPRTAGTTFYLSHWAETLHFTPKLRQTSSFYRGGMTSADGAKFLASGAIRYVIQSQYEVAACGYADLAGQYGLKPVWSGGTGGQLVRVFEVPGRAEHP